MSISASLPPRLLSADCGIAIRYSRDFYGNGPVRTTHSGLLDYGPHALALCWTLGINPELTWHGVLV